MTHQNTYKGSFEILHGVCHILGAKDDDTITLQKDFSASDELEAFAKVYEHAEKLSKDCLTDNSGKTTVIVTLYGPNGKELDQLDIFSNLVCRAYKNVGAEKFEKIPEGALEETIAEEFQEGKLKVVSSYIEHVLDL